MILIKTGNIEVEILCHQCKSPTTKKLKYLKDRIRGGKFLFFCTRKCADNHHSSRMKGESNPNFKGKWNGPPVDQLFTKEQLRKQGYKSIEKMKEDGTFHERMKKLQDGHRKYFSTEEGKEKRRQLGVLGYLSFSNKSRTSIEIKMAEELERREINYIEQYNLGDKFLLDFLLPEYGIVIECDGDYWHNLPQNIKRDKAKNAYIKACGYSLYRFWEHEINTDIEACVDVIMAEINAKEII